MIGSWLPGPAPGWWTVQGLVVCLIMVWVTGLCRDIRRGRSRAGSLVTTSPRRGPRPLSRGFGSPGDPTSPLLRTLQAASGRLGPTVARLRWSVAGSDTDNADLLESVARSLRSGSSLLDALEGATRAVSAPVASELARCLVAVRNGEPLGHALTRWASGSDPARTVAGVALALGADLGGARAQALDAAAAGLRDRGALAREIRALTSQARASAAVMVLAPVAFVGFGLLSGGGVTATFATPVGLGCLVAGLLLDVAGAWWMAAWTRRVS